MPIDYRKYPADWQAVRAAILERAGDKCEWCGVPNGAYRITYRDGSEVIQDLEDGLIQFEGDLLDGVAKCARIVLTIAHVHDPNPMNVDPANLAALCQRCHNRHDAPMRAANRKAKAGQLSLEVTE